MWSIVSSMKLLRKPSKRGEGDIERNKGSTASLKDNSKEASLTHLDSDTHVNLDPSCSTVGGSAYGSTSLNATGKSATLGSTSGAGSSSSNSGSKVKVERRESARLASSATKFLRSLRNHSGSGKIVASSVIAADDKHPINVIALKELDIDTHSLNPGAAANTGTLGYPSSAQRGSGSSSAKLPERSQSFNEKRLLVVTQNTSSENTSSSGNTGSSGQVKVKHSRAQSFVCNNSNSRNKSGYSIYLNHHHQFQSTQQNQANLAKQQFLFEQKQNNIAPNEERHTSSQQSSQTQQQQQTGKSGKTDDKADKTNTTTNSTSESSAESHSSSSTSSSSSSRTQQNIQPYETIYENLEVILEEKQNQEQMTNKSNIPCNKDHTLQIGHHINKSKSKSYATDNKGNQNDTTTTDDSTTERGGGSGSSSKTVAAASSSESLDVNMRITGKDRDRVCQTTKKYNKDSGYETNCSDYSNIPKSSSVDSIESSRMTTGMDQRYSMHPSGYGRSANSEANHRILNTSIYGDLNVSAISDEMQNSAKKHSSSSGASGSSGGRKLRRSISEVPPERNTNLAKLQTKVGDSTARAMYTIGNGFAVWTTEKSSSSLGLNTGANIGSSQTLNQQHKNVYGSRHYSQLKQLPSSHGIAPIPGGFSAAVQQASVYSTLPRNHTTTTTSDGLGIYRGGYHYLNTAQAHNSHQSQSASEAYHHYHQIAAKSTPSLRNAVSHETQMQNKFFNDATEQKETSPPTSYAAPESQQQSNYQTVPIPTLSPARSTPNLGSSGVNKLRSAQQQQQQIQGSIPQLSVVSSHQQVNDLGKQYPSSTTHSHQKLYNNHFGSSSSLAQQSALSALQLQQLNSNDNVFAEPGRYPSTPNLQKSDSTNLLSAPNSNESSSHSDNHFSSGEPSGQQYESNSSGTNNPNNNSNVGAMSTSNDTNTSAAQSGGNWNTIDTQCLLNNNNINNNNNNNNNSAPVRDSSSLKQIRYGPGHEKYPSWPIPVSSAQQVDPVGESQPVKLVVGSGSTRSKSWTEQTDYPKEKTPSYARPYMKRVNHSYTQQLKTVMEKCERLPPEAFTSQADPQLLHSVLSQANNASRHSPHHHHHHQLAHGGHPKSSEGSIVPPPLLYRDLLFSQQNGHMNTNYNTNQMLQYYQAALSAKPQQTGSGNGNEKEYMIPSPPERDFSEPQGTVSKPLTQEDLELYTKKYEELITQYPQSEGYHSYISSDGSSYISSGTPFLDQLRRESENNQQFWSGDKSANGAGCDPNDPLFGLVGGQLAAAVSGRESVTTVVTNSSSNSSGGETLKWHGSTSDISLASGVGGNTISNFKSNSHNHNSARKSGSSSTSSMLNKGWNEQQNIANSSSRLSTPQKQQQQQHAPNSDAMCSHPSQQQQQGGVVHLRNKLEQLNGSPSLKKWQSNNNGDTVEHSNSNKSCNNSNNSGGGGGGSYAPNLKKFPLNTYTRPNTLLVEKGMNSNNVSNSSSATSTPEKMAKLLQSLNAETSSNTMNLKGAKSLSHSLSSPVIDTSKPPSVAERIMELEQQTHQQSSTSPSTSGTSSPKIGQGQSSDNLAFLGTTTFVKSSSLNNLQNSPSGLYIDEGNLQSQQQQQQNEWLSSSQGSQGGGRSNTVSPRGMLSSFSSSSAKQLSSESPSSAMSYSYLDPDKKHKVADMTLKAIQKKALLSYYERHRGKCANNSSSSSVSSSDSNSGTPDVVSLEKDLCFSGKSSRLMLSLPKEHSVGSVDQNHQNAGGMLSENTSSRNSTSSSSGMNPSASSSPSLTGGYRAISASSSGVSSSSSTSSRINSASNPKVSSQSQHQQLVNGANHNNSPKTSQSSSTITTGLCEELSPQVDKSESRQLLQCSTPDVDSTQGSESARLAYMSKYLPHLVNREPASSSTAVWPSNSLPKLPQGSADRNGSTAPVTQEPAPIPPERPPKKPHLRNLAQQAHEESNDSKPPPPLPRAPVRPPALLNNGTSKANSITSGSAAPPIPSKPALSVPSGTLGVVRSPSPDELPPPPPPPTNEEMEAFLNDEPLPPPPPSVTDVDALLGPRSRSVSGLSSCLHKDSYMAQRKERTLGYEGRYRRTLSPSGLGSNNSNAKSSLESTSLGSSDSVGSTRSVTNLATGKLDTTLSPSAWEKFHNIRPPSTTVIFTSHELSKAVGAPPASTGTTSSSPHPPSSQPLFHRSISCDSNIFNNKTGASQSSIPPPVAQVAPLRGSTSNYNGAENTFEKCSQGATLRNDVNVCGGLRDVIPVSTSQISALSIKSCNNDDNGNQLATRENLSNFIDSDGSCEREERYYREQLYRPPEHSSKKELDDHKEQVLLPVVTSTSNCRTSGVSYSNSALPSVIVPPLQYERCEKETMSNNATLLSPLYTGESHTILKKSEVSLRVNCTSDVALQTDLINGISQKERSRKEGKENAALTSSTESELPVSTPHNSSPTPEGCPNNKGCNLSSSNNASNSTASFYTGRQKTQEELECEELSRDIAKLLPQGDKLQTLLVPLPDHKTTADYMEGLFHLELKLQPETVDRRGSQGGAGPATNNQDKLSVEMIQESGIIEGLKMKAQVSPMPEGMSSQNQKTVSETTAFKLERTDTGLGDKNKSDLNTEVSHKMSRNHSHKTSDPSTTAALIVSSVTDTKAGSNSLLNDGDRKSSNMLTASYRRCNGHAPLPADSAYFTTSESKAKFLTQYNSDIKKEPINGSDGEELDKQKEELVSRISRKLEILRTEQLLLREEIQSNEQLGQMVVERVKQTAKRNEFDKFKLHVEEIEKITSLLLGISGRLARAENALMGLSDPPNPQEKKILESKRDKLREQLDEAKILKENIDRRSAQVSSFLQKYLTVEEYADYDHFVKMKAKLIIDAREIDDKIKLGEEQLGALKDALNTTLPLSPNSSSS